jgi:hypothetical protein
MPDQDRRTQLAVALLRRAEAVLQLPYSPAEVVMRPLFPGGRAMLGAYGIDSLDLVEAMVAIDEDLGVLLIDRVTLVEARSLQGIADLLLQRADARAVERFCDAWSTVGVYRA